MLSNKSISISSLLRDENGVLLIKEIFEAAFDCFNLILEGIPKINDSLFSRMESIINIKLSITDVFQFVNILLKKIQKDDACSIYYQGIKNIQYGIDEKTDYEKFINSLDAEKKDYIKKLIRFIKYLKTTKIFKI